MALICVLLQTHHVASSQTNTFQLSFFLATDDTTLPSQQDYYYVKYYYYEDM